MYVSGIENNLDIFWKERNGDQEAGGMICSGLEDGRTEGPFKRKHYVTQGKAASGNLKEGNQFAWVWRVGRKRDVCGWMERG